MTPLVDLYHYSQPIFWIFITIFCAVLFTGAWAGISAAPWVPTKKRERKLLAEKLEVKPGFTVYDLGCGTGTVLFELAKKHKDAKFIGCEISALPYLVAKIRSLFWQNVSIKYNNLFLQPINDADIVTIFLLTKAYNRLQAKFKKELKPEAQIVVQGWAIETVQPQQKFKTEKALPFYIYKGSDFK